MSVIPKSKWRTFKGVEYLNCDAYTEAEMDIIANWENAPKAEREAFAKKCGWEDRGLFTPLFERP